MAKHRKVKIINGFPHKKCNECEETKPVEEQPETIQPAEETQKASEEKAPEKAPEKDNLHAKIRYRAKDTSCKIIDLNPNNLEVEFEQPCFAIAPGQSIVFYDKDICLGGAIIESYSN